MRSTEIAEDGKFTAELGMCLRVYIALVFLANQSSLRVCGGGLEKGEDR